MTYFWSFDEYLSQAFFQGKVKIAGNVGLAMKLRELQTSVSKSKLWCVFFIPTPAIVAKQCAIILVVSNANNNQIASSGIRNISAWKLWFRLCYACDQSLGVIYLLMNVPGKNIWWSFLILSQARPEVSNYHGSVMLRVWHLMIRYLSASCWSVVLWLA